MTEIEAGVVLAERFRIRRRLGRGGTATVFLAEDSVLGRDVAIKQLHAEGSEADARRFRREARLGASLIHPNLVTVFDTISGDDGAFIVMEYVRGRPLSDLIPTGGMDTGEMLGVLRPVAAALDYAHEHGVVHRDVKPANVLIGEDRIVKLVDLGTATAGDVTQITTENQVMGTLAYIAPERLSGDSAGEPAADVYSLAVVAFEALTGHPPHRAGSPAELLSKVESGPAGGALESWPDAPPKLAQVLSRGMDPDPERRQRTAGTFVADLERALADRAPAATPAEPPRTEPMESPAASPPTPPPADPSPRPFVFEPRRRRPSWLVPMLACAAVLIAVGVVLALSLGGGGTGGGGTAGDTQAGDQPSRQAKAGEGQGASAASSGGSSAVPAPSSSPDPAAGAQLNELGYSLIQQGQYARAIPVLRQAVSSFPEGTTDINYAYALYNLGHALRMAGHPEEAVPILERRLQIPDQTDVVRGELDAARAAAGQ